MTDITKDKRSGKKGSVCVLKSQVTKEVEYLPLESCKITYNGTELTLKELIDSLESKISTLESTFITFKEKYSTLIESALKVATTALEVAEKQSIQIETINQEVFK